MITVPAPGTEISGTPNREDLPMDDLINKIRAAIDEDEHTALAAIGDHNRAIADWTEPSSGIVEIGPNEDDLITNDAMVARHIVRQDPARVLRQVAAHRAMLVGVEKHYDPHPGQTCDNVDEVGNDLWGPCTLHMEATGRISDDVLPLLAAIYGIEVPSR